MDAEAAALATRLAENLRTLRRARGWTQAVLAERTDLSPHYIAVIEAGQRLPTLSTLAVFAREFGVPAERLISAPAVRDDWLRSVHDMAATAPNSARTFIAEAMRLAIDHFPKDDREKAKTSRGRPRSGTKRPRHP